MFQQIYKQNSRLLF